MTYNLPQLLISFFAFVFAQPALQQAALVWLSGKSKVFLSMLDQMPRNQIVLHGLLLLSSTAVTAINAEMAGKLHDLKGLDLNFLANILQTWTAGYFAAGAPKLLGSPADAAAGRTSISISPQPAPRLE